MPISAPNPLRRDANLCESEHRNLTILTKTRTEKNDEILQCAQDDILPDKVLSILP